MHTTQNLSMMHNLFLVSFVIYYFITFIILLMHKHNSNMMHVLFFLSFVLIHLS
jgi:hypothetical protein